MYKIRCVTESLELLHPISHHWKVCYLGQSVQHLPSCILVTVGSWTLTRPASPATYQMFVTPHSVEHLFICQSHPTQLTVQDRWDNPAGPQTSSTWTTDDKRWAAGLSQQQHVLLLCNHYSDVALFLGCSMYITHVLLASVLCTL